MESVAESLLTSPTVIAAIFVGATVLILVYISKMFRKEDVIEHKVKNEKSSHLEKKKDAAHSGKTKKKVAENRWTGRNEKQAYAHPWLLTSLKGHTGTILDMNFSSNGKYLTSCGDEDPDPGGLTTESSSSSSECNKENSRPPSVEPSPRAKGLSRRQRKNRRREDSPPESQKQKKQKAKKAPSSAAAEPGMPMTKRKVMAAAPLKQYLKLNVSERVFAGLLHNYLLTYDEMMTMGYPVECSLSQGLVEIQKHANHRVPTLTIHNGGTKFDVNAREFVPKHGWTSSDSGRGSGSSSDSGENFDSEESSSSSDQDYAIYYQQSLAYQLPTCYGGGPVPESASAPADCFKRTCTRCGRMFFTSSTEYLTFETCSYHWGRLRTVNEPGDVQRHGQLEYNCCHGEEGSRGCMLGRLHVWDGVVNGNNGPYKDYVCTKPRRTPPPDGNYGVYSIDCEMCYTVRGLELTKVTVVGMDGRLVYDSFVKPDADIVDYNTRFSGISARDLTKRGGTKKLRDVQNDLMGFINANTVLIGHGLENDLRALKIVHHVVVDTAYCFPHYNGLPYKRSLRSLVSSYLRREIQCGGADGHNSYEDASACMELMLWRVRRDFRGYLMRF